MKLHTAAALLVTLPSLFDSTTVQAGLLPRFKSKHNHLAFVRRDGGGGVNDPGWTSKQDSKSSFLFDISMFSMIRGLT